MLAKLRYRNLILSISPKGKRGKSVTPLECHVLFLGLLLGGANMEWPGDNQEKKFYIDNTAQALIPSGDISLP